MIQQCMQSSGYTVNAYFHKKMSLCHANGLDFAETREQFLMGLVSEEIVHALIGKAQVDAYKLLSHINAVEHIQTGRREMVQYTQNKSNTQSTNFYNTKTRIRKPVEQQTVITVTSTRKTKYTTNNIQ